ncbi:MAG: DUF1440 domain-containing protein [Actinomycetota bacterium]|nr:DUF1440 domain-containing protein [Actinomycetota bacterium]
MPLGRVKHRDRSMLSAMLRGAVAGAVGTVALDAANYAQYRMAGGTDAPLAWEFSAGLDSWESAPAPAKAGKLMFEALFRRELPATSARTMNNVTHWGYGLGWGAQYGVIATSNKSLPLQGPLFGTVVWLSSYVVLPLLRLYQPIWRYDAKTLAKDWAPHVAYGTATAGAFKMIAHGS